MLTNTSKPASFKAGLFFLVVFTFAMGALGVYGWWKSDMDLITRSVLCFGAGATALVIPFTVIALGRSFASLAVIPVLALCMGMQAVSFHNFVGSVIEAPHKAAFDRGLQSLAAEVARTTERLDTAQAAIDTFPALALPDCLCPKTTAAKVSAWEAQRNPLSKAVDTAKADRLQAIQAHETASKAYQPLAPDHLVWIVGGLLDLSIALAIWALEMTANRARKEHETRLASEARAAEKRLERRQQKEREARAAQRAAREKKKALEAKKALKTRPTEPFVPRLVAANDA